MTGGLGVGYSSLLFASKATFVARVSPGSAPKSCRFVFGIGCLSASCFLLVEDSGTCCHREILIQNLAAAFASSVASRCVPARYVTNSSCCRRHFVVNWLALSDAGQRIGLPQLLGQGRLLLVEKSFVQPERRSQCVYGRPARAASVSRSFFRLRKNDGPAKARHFSHTHTVTTASPQVFDTHADIRQVCPCFQTLLSWSPTPPNRPVPTVAVLLGRSFPS